ncbi:MAG: molybdopterin-dependent oxidoreductase, partial [Chloroflexota bacterium]
MRLTRRNFLAWTALSAIGAVACRVGIREGELAIQSPVQMPEDLVKGTDNWYATLCRNCPSAEGIIVRVMEGRAKKIQGNPDYPTNQGKQSPRCDAGLQAVYHPDRLAGPLRRGGPRGSGQWEAIDWGAALDILKRELAARGDGMLLVTEPLRGHLGMVARRFATSLGGRHLAFEAMDNVTYRTAIKNLFGQDLLPDFDLEHSNFILSFGADFLSTWVSPTRWNRGYGQFRQGSDRRRRGTLVHVEPRFSLTAASADKWVPLPPGWEGYLALSLAYVILEENLEAPGVDVGALMGGRPRQAFLAEELREFRPEAVADRIQSAAGKVELPQNLGADSLASFIRKLAADFATNRPSLAIGGGSAGAHSNGLFNLEAIYALNYLVGSVGAVGGIKFNPGSPLPDLPAASEVGSLADWGRVAEELRKGSIRLLLVHQANPIHGLPDAVGLREAVDRDDLFIASFSSFLDDTTAMADLILPDRVSLEDWGDDIPEPGPGYQVLGFQQPVVNPLSDLDPRSFPDVLLTMAQELGKDGQLPWGSFQELLREGAGKLLALSQASPQASPQAAS